MSDGHAIVKPLKQDSNRKRGSNRTLADDARLRELETVSSLWLDSDNQPIIGPRQSKSSILSLAFRRLEQ